MIASIVAQPDPGRITPLYREQPVDRYEQLAELLIHDPAWAGPVLIATGFAVRQPGSVEYDDPPWTAEHFVPETDGPPGGALLARALEKLGRPVALAADHLNLAVVRAAGEAAGTAAPVLDLAIGRAGDAWRIPDAIEAFAPSVVIAIEFADVSIGAPHRAHDARGRKIAGVPLAPLFDGRRSIGIGDGGNEIGMVHFPVDRLRPAVRFPLIATETTHGIVASVSNWGAYGLCAALEMVSGTAGLLPDAALERAVRERIADAGAVEGFSKSASSRVDTFGDAEHADLLARLAAQVAIATPFARELGALQRRWRSEHAICLSEARWAVRQSADGVQATVAATVFDSDHDGALMEAFVRANPLAPLCSPKIRTLYSNDGIGSGIGAPCGFVTVNDGARILREPRIDAEVTTELVAGDPPLKAHLLHHDAAHRWWFVETADHATGWMPELAVLPAEIAGVMDPWQSHRWDHGIDPFLTTETVENPGEMLRTTQASLAAAMAELRTWADAAVPYVWGGRSDRGVDCSGFSQRFAWRWLGVPLPRHSSLQRRCGVRAARGDLRLGDLVYLAKEQVGHVAVVSSAPGEPVSVLHASRDRMCVVEEPLDEVLKRARFLIARRWADW
jgi:hypothetical protein